jgi:hypothetical protein
MARNWYGYGRWSAPYWFIGIEPGGDELEACVRMWHSLGTTELVDIAEHHRGHARNWFDDSARTQATWAKLIWLMLAYKGVEPDRRATLNYQRQHLGRINNETALIEISSIPAQHNGIQVPRELFRQRRIKIIRERLLHRKPRFVVFYSPDRRYLNAWEQIANCELRRDEPKMVNGSVCIVTYHPNGKWSKAYWAHIGRQLRQITGEH